jgi:hypothetical protein
MSRSRSSCPCRWTEWNTCLSASSWWPDRQRARCSD